MNYVEQAIPSILEQFELNERIVSCKPHGSGHINSTFLVVTADDLGNKRSLILQKVNQNVFPNPEQVIDNIEKVTNHIKTKVADPTRETLSLIPTKQGSCCCKSADGNFWRMYPWIEALCLDAPRSADDFYQSGFAFGRFQQQLSDFDATALFEVIEGFHDTAKRYEAFCKAVERDPLGRAKDVADEIQFVTDRKAFTRVLEPFAADGRLPLRVTHNDTKLNNVLLDLDGKALCVIDLDTVMPGYSVNDFGDSIRFGASTAAEDETDLDKVNLDLDLYKTYTEGFLDGCNHALTDTEVELFPEGAKLMTFECGMRFLTDYLLGDTYFKTAYPTHNLVRARTQFKLVTCMEQHWDTLKQITREAANR